MFRFAGVGWRYSRWNGTGSDQWSSPGGWADCNNKSSTSITIPFNDQSSNTTRTFTIDSGLVTAWLNNGGKNNFGLLLRGIVGNNLQLMSYSKATSLGLRPSLRIKWSTQSGVAAPSTPTYPVSYTSVARTIWVDGAGGDDLNGIGTQEYPYKSLLKASYESLPGDTIYLRGGLHAGGVDIYTSSLTIQSAPGEWAVIASTLTDPIASNNVLTIRPSANNTVIRNLEITGGFYYGIMFWSEWENYPTIQQNVYLATAASHCLIDNVRIHDTGSSAIKMVMKVFNITIQNCEIFNTGARYRTYGHGVEGVQTQHVTVQDCYIHDIPDAAVHLVGGSTFGVIQRNYIANTEFGLNIGFATEYEYMDPIHNPLLYEHLHGLVANNIITGTTNAGINLWAAYNITIIYNTLWNVQQLAQDAILLNSYQHVDAPGAPTIGCANITIIGNILTKSSTARAGPIIQIRVGGLSTSKYSYLNMGYNVYYDGSGLGSPSWQWGKGIMLEDERIGLAFVGNYTMWNAHCSSTLQQQFCDVNSIEADPKLDSKFSPQTCSEAINRVLYNPKLMPNVDVDFHGRKRSYIIGSQTAGAIATGITGTIKSIPPVFSAFTNIAPYMGYGLPKAYYDTYGWPFHFWLTRTCVDIYVDALHGDDTQTFNYISNYTKPFKTIMQAMISINQCDRIVLKGNQTHQGPIGIYR